MAPRLPGLGTPRLKGQLTSPSVRMIVVFFHLHQDAQPKGVPGVTFLPAFASHFFQRKCVSLDVVEGENGLYFSVIERVRKFFVKLPPALIKLQKITGRPTSCTLGPNFRCPAVTNGPKNTISKGIGICF